MPDDLIEPTDEERRNGWDAETLTAYVAERNRARDIWMDPHERPRHRPALANSKYSPFRWRG